MDYSSPPSFSNLRRHRPPFPLTLPGFQSSEAGYLSSSCSSPLPAPDTLEPFGSEEEEPAPVFLPSNASSGPRRGESGGHPAFFDTAMDSNLGDDLAAECDRSDNSWYDRGRTDVWGSERTAESRHSEADCYGNTVNGFYPTSCSSEEGLRQADKAKYAIYTQTVYNREANGGCFSEQIASHCRNGYSRMGSREADDYTGREEDYGSSCGSAEEPVHAVEVEGPWHSVSPLNQGEGRWREVLEDHQSLPERPHTGRAYSQKLDSFSEAFLSQRKRRPPLAAGGDSSEQMWEFGGRRGESTEPVKSRQSCGFGLDPYLPPSSSSSSPALPGVTSFPSPPTSSHLMSSVLSPPPTPLPPSSHSPSKMDSPGCGAGGEPRGTLQFFTPRPQSVPLVAHQEIMWKFPPLPHCFPQPGGKTGNIGENPRPSDSGDLCYNTVTRDIPQVPQSVFLSSSSLHPTRALCSSINPSLHASFHLPPCPPRRQLAEDHTVTQKAQNRALPQNAAPSSGRPFPSVFRSRRGQKRDRYTPQPLLNPHRKGAGLFCSLSSLHHQDEGAACGEEEEECSVSPSINVGPEYQADLPSCSEDGKWPEERPQGHDPPRERLLWKPWDQLEESANLQDQVETLLSMCSSSCLPGGGSNTELALHCLHGCQGNAVATVELLLYSQPSPTGDYHYSGCDFWTDSEKSLFSAALATSAKDFSMIQKMVKTKSVHQCVEFYYLSKKLQDKQKKQEEEERRYEEMERQRSETTKCQAVDRRFIREEVVPVPPLASYFPCKLCGKMFYKIKSRNAHMKIHRQPQEDWSDRRLQHQLLTQRLALSHSPHFVPIPGPDLLPPQASALTFPSSALLESSNINPDDVNNPVTNGSLILPCNPGVLSLGPAVSYSSIVLPNSHLIANIDGGDSSQRGTISVSPFQSSWSSSGHQTDLTSLCSNPGVKVEEETELISWQ